MTALVGSLNAFGNAIGQGLMDQSQPQASGVKTTLTDEDVKWLMSENGLHDYTKDHGVQVADFVRNNNEYVTDVGRPIVGTPVVVSDAPTIPGYPLPEGIDPTSVQGIRDRAGLMYLMAPEDSADYLPPKDANLFVSGARDIVSQGRAGLESGSITPSQYLDAVRFLTASSAALEAPTPVFRVEVTGVGVGQPSPQTEDWAGKQIYDGMNERLSGMVNDAQDQYVQDGAQSSGWRYGLNAAGYVASSFFPKSVGEAAFDAVGGPLIGKTVGLVGSMLPRVAPGIAGTFQRGVQPTVTLLDEVRSKGIGFDKFRQLRAAMSPAPGEHNHHIVEQTPGNVARFGVQTIHNTAGFVPVQATTHIGKESISAFYSSKRRFTNGITVREWLSTQSFDDQYRFGMQVLSDFGVIE